MIRGLIKFQARWWYIELLAVIIFIAGYLFFENIKREETVTIALREATVLFVKGDVRVKIKERGDWIGAVPDMPVLNGYSLKTGKASWAEIGFGESLRNVVRVKELTRIDLVNIEGPVKIGLLKGELRSLVEELERDSTFEIKTPTAICGARGTGWDTASSGHGVVVDAYENEVYLRRLSEGAISEVSIIIKAGKSGMLKGPAGPVEIKDLSPERIENWDRWKEGFLERQKVLKRVDRGSPEKVKGPRVSVIELEDGDYQLMVADDETESSDEGSKSNVEE